MKRATEEIRNKDGKLKCIGDNATVVATRNGRKCDALSEITARIANSTSSSGHFVAHSVLNE